MKKNFLFISLLVIFYFISIYFVLLDNPGGYGESVYAKEKKVFKTGSPSPTPATTQTPKSTPTPKPTVSPKSSPTQKSTFSPMGGQKAEPAPLSESDYIFTVNGRIVKTKAVIKQGSAYISGEGVVQIFKTLGGDSSIERESGLIAINIKPESQNTPDIKIPSPSEEAVIIVLNGKIYKSHGLTGEKGFYIPLRTIQSLLLSLGAKVETEPEHQVVAILWEPEKNRDTMGSTPGKAVDNGNGSSSSQVKPESSSIPPSPVLLSDPAKVRSYLDSLKGVFDNNKPSREEREKFQDYIMGLSDIKDEDIKPIRLKFKKSIDEINKLSPPDEETADIQTLAISVYDKMIKVIDLTTVVINTKEGYANPDAMNQIQILLQEIDRDSLEFDTRVKAIRKKYNLPPP